MEVTSNGDGWWHCHSCSHTFVTCDYSYRILIQLEDSTGTCMGRAYLVARQKSLKRRNKTEFCFGSICIV
jgi:hypothetical protein